MPRFLRRQTIATIVRNFWMFRPWSIRAIRRGFGNVNLSLLRPSQVVKMGYVFGQERGNGGQSGGVCKFNRFAGSYPPPLVVKRGNPLAPSSAAVLLGPRTYPKKTNGVRPRRGLRASCQRFGIAFEAGWDTWERMPCARFVYTPKWSKHKGVHPPLTISIFLY